VSEDIREHAQKLAKSLEEAGHADHAAKMQHVLAGNQVENAFLWALRGVCDTLLKMVEAIDPVPHAARNFRSKHRLWICAQRKRVEHIPTGATIIGRKGFHS